MSHFRPSSDERDILKKAVAKFAHDPRQIATAFLRLDAEDADYSPGNEEWNHLKFCIEQHHLHARNRSAAGSEKETGEAQLDKADALARKFHPDFS
jgi:hypothetical protein